MNCSCRDNIPCVIIKTWPLAAPLFDSDIIAGVVPTLFAENPEAAIEAMKNNPGKAHNDVAKINKVFFIPEEVNIEEANAILKKPR